MACFNSKLGNFQRSLTPKPRSIKERYLSDYCRLNYLSKRAPGYCVPYVVILKTVSKKYIASPLPIGCVEPVSNVRFFGCAHFSCKKEKNGSANFQWNRSNNEKFKVNSKYYREHQRTCNILITYTYLMTTILIYLLMDCEKLN